MSHPPPKLDNADVLFWAWSGEQPFGVLPDGLSGIHVFGFAICRYADSGTTYRFTCDQSWNVVQDAPCSGLDDPFVISHQYDTGAIVWMEYRPSGSVPLHRPTQPGKWISSALHQFLAWH